MKTLKVNQQHLKTLPMAKSTLVVLITVMITILCTNSMFAQTWSGMGDGDPLDRWTINDDNSNHWAHLRLQVGHAHSWNMVNQGSLLWWGYGQNSNYNDAGVIKMGLTSDAKFGLGIIPTQALHIKGQTNNENPVIFLEPKTWTGPGHYGEIRFGDFRHYIRGEHNTGMSFYDVNGFYFSTDGTNKLAFSTTGNLGIGMNDPKIDVAIGDHDTGLNQNGDGELGIYTDDVERIRVDNTGNVGVGTIDPAEKLHVVGNIRLEGDFDLLHNKSIKSEGIMHIQADDDNSGDGIIHFKAGPDTRMTMLDNGNVGIGLTNPGYELEVDGTIRSTSMIASSASFPDYVFADDYKILPLEELEQYVKKHKHLPNMPAEAEIVENGLNITDILTRSVENIETIYLHMIELKKEIQLLKKDNESLRSELQRKGH